MPFLGHAGIILINNKTGETRYYEYGRYDKAGLGIVRRVRVPNVTMDKKTGMPTPKSLEKLLSKVSTTSGKGTRIEGTYVKNENYAGMVDYAEGRLKQNTDPKRKPYGIMGNNCGT